MKEKGIKGIIFDFGDVIFFYDKTDLLESHSIKRGFPQDTFFKLFDEYLLVSHEGGTDSLEQYFSEHPLPEGVTIKDMEDIWKEWDETCWMDNEVVEYIQSLKGQYKIGMLSNFGPNLNSWLKDNFKIHHLFDVVVCSYDIKMRKPDVRAFLHTLNEMGLEAGETVFVDDKDKNVEAAKSLGMQAILYTSFPEFKKQIQEILK